MPAIACSPDATILYGRGGLTWVQRSEFPDVRDKYDYQDKAIEIIEAAARGDGALKIKYEAGVAPNSYKAYIYDKATNSLLIVRSGRFENVFRPTRGVDYFNEQHGRIIPGLIWP